MGRPAPPSPMMEGWTDLFSPFELISPGSGCSLAHLLTARSVVGMLMVSCVNVSRVSTYHVDSLPGLKIK